MPFFPDAPHTARFDVAHASLLPKSPARFAEPTVRFAEPTARFSAA